jgi:ankyrin repeat protein
MSSVRKRFTVLTLFLFTALSLWSQNDTLLLQTGSIELQPDSLRADSIISRIRVLLAEYNQQNRYVDISEYLTDGYDADDINLQIAASKGACNEIVRLYAEGADVNNFEGRIATPLHYAVTSGSKHAVELLLLLGASPDSYDVYGITPLISAVRSNDLETAEILIRYGASTGQVDRTQASPLHHAAALGYFYIADMLLYYDSPADLKDSEGNTPLMVGVTFGYPDISDLLLQNGVDPNVPDRKGITPLMAAAFNGDTLMMKLIVDAGANLYALSSDGADALGFAVMSGKKEAVEFLLERGNRWYYSEGDRVNPVLLAKYAGYRDILQLLHDKSIEKKTGFNPVELSVSALGMITSHCSMAGASISVADPSLRTAVFIGAASDPVSRKLLLQGDHDILYQYSTRMSLIHAGLSKEFLLSRPANLNRLTFTSSLAAGYRFYSIYEGTSSSPDNKFCIIPTAELTWRRKGLGIGAGVTWLNTPFHKVSPAWFTLKVSYVLTRTAGIIPVKKTRIYNYGQR